MTAKQDTYIGLRLPAAVLAQADRLAVQKAKESGLRVTRSDVLRLALAEYLERSTFGGAK
jgi:hypothetical protein